MTTENYFWKTADQVPQEILNQNSNLSPLILQLLYNRGVVDVQEIKHFLTPDYDRDVHDPFLFDDMRKAVDRITAAITNKEKIIIHGDYDADGVCGSTLLYELFKILGANVDVYLPHREDDGYGMKEKTIPLFAEQQAKLLITVDCGIANKTETELANKHGIDVIITDHHTEPDTEEGMPPAVAIIHPRVHADRYPFDHLAGVGSAFKLAQGLIRDTENKDLQTIKENAQDHDGNPINWEAYEKWQLDLVSIATITDCMPLKGENRTLVSYGFLVLEKTPRQGLRSLMAAARVRGQKPSSKMIGFDIGPRINAAGRIDHALTAFELMTSKEEDHADMLAAKLETINNRRRTVSKKMVDEAHELIQKDLTNMPHVITAYNPEWPMGTLGLVAGRMSNAYNKPVVLLTQKEGALEGTSRSIPGFSVLSLFDEISPILHKYGGHAAAAGLGAKEGITFEHMQEELQKAGEKLLAQADLRPILNIDSHITLQDLHWDFWTNLEQMEPFGQENPKPTFVIPNVELADVRTVGKTNAHLRLRLHQNGKHANAIGFSFGKWAEKLQQGDYIDLACAISVNEWNGSQELQLEIVDLKKAE